MSPYTITHYGNTQKKHSDICILLPHSGESPEWIPLIRKSMINTNTFSDEILYRFIRHEADRGGNEIVENAITVFLDQYKETSLRITVFKVHIPRGFCDTNRMWEFACPTCIDTALWKSLYDETSIALHSVIQNTGRCLQFHTMCSKNPIYPWKFSTETSSEELENFLTTCYSGAPRACNILTKTETGERVTDPIFDSVIQDVFQEYHIPMDENVAYVLPLHYPATIIARKAPSSIIEITKGSLSADESGKSTDSSQIQFHPDKIMYFGRMFSEILQRVSV